MFMSMNVIFQISTLAFQEVLVASVRQFLSLSDSLLYHKPISSILNFRDFGVLKLHSSCICDIMRTVLGS